MRIRRVRQAFTLVELLVVIAIIGILIAMLLPAVQAAREAARRIRCTNNLKQLGLAMHHYHDTHNVFPYGFRNDVPRERDCWFHRILPFIEQKALYDQYQHGPDALHLTAHSSPASERQAIVPSLSCPSDPNAPGEGGGGGQSFQGNYIVCTGSDNVVTAMVPSGNLNGIFYYLSANGFQSIRDGTTNTLLASESVVHRRGTKWGWGVAGGYWGGSTWGSFGFTTFQPPNSPQPDRVYECKDNNAPAAPCVDYIGAGDRWNYARSYHRGGVNATLADASVRFISDTVNPATFQALGTRNLQEVVGEF